MPIKHVEKKKILSIKENGWTIKLGKCPIGFFTFEGNICFKSQLVRAGYHEVFEEDGSFFWGNCRLLVERDNLLVQPIKFEWITILGEK